MAHDERANPTENIQDSDQAIGPGCIRLILVVMGGFLIYVSILTLIIESEQAHQGCYLYGYQVCGGSI